jgi:hypothetical protein
VPPDDEEVLIRGESESLLGDPVADDLDAVAGGECPNLQERSPEPELRPVCHGHRVDSSPDLDANTLDPHAADPAPQSERGSTRGPITGVPGQHGQGDLAAIELGDAAPGPPAATDLDVETEVLGGPGNAGRTFAV